MRDITCSNCGRVFQADESVQRAYCVYCGQVNELNISAADDGASTPESKQYQDWKDRIEQIRFQVWNKKTGEKGDTFIGFWSMLMFHGRNSRGFFGLKRAAKEANRFWQKPAIAEVLAEAGDQAEKLIAEQLYDSARAFYQTCRDDRHYGSKMLDMVKLKPEQIADKAAAEVSELIFSYWLHFEPIAYRDHIYRAAWFAYAPSFAEKGNGLAQRVKQLPEDERRQLSEILGVVI
jgi:predicted  nucleic acid-binding Zn-ribbon protein